MVNSCLTAVLGVCASKTSRIALPNAMARSKLHQMTLVDVAARKPRRCREKHTYEAIPCATAGKVCFPRSQVSKGYFEIRFHNRSCAPKNYFKVTLRYASPVRCTRDGHHSQFL